MSLGVGVLGPFEANVGPTRLVLGRPTLRALLAMLALAEGRSVRHDDLTDGIWGDAAPNSPRSTIHVGISRLRKLLGDESPRLTSSAAGYALALERDDCDAVRAADRLASARVAGRERSFEAAVDDCVHALALWRGDPLAEFEGAPFALRWAARLDNIRLGLVEVRNEAWLALGRAAEVLEDIDDALLLDPLRESLHGQRMLALYRCGRQADAIAAYEALRSRLARDLGIEPVPAVQALYRGVLDHDPALESPGTVGGIPAVVASAERTALITRVEGAIERATDPGHEVRAHLLVALAEIQHDAGDPRWKETAGAAFAIACGSTDLALLADSAGVGAHGWPTAPERIDTERIAVLRRATAMARDDETVVRLSTALAGELVFSAPLAERIALADRALVAARRTDNVAMELFVLTEIFHALWAPETLDRRDRETVGALEIAEDFAAPFPLGIAAGVRMVVAIERADLTEVDRCQRILAAAAEASGSTMLAWGVPLHASWRAVLAGDLVEAENRSYEALGVGEQAGRPEARVVFVTQRVGLRWMQGRLAEELTALEELVGAAPYLAALRAWLATAARQSGDGGRAADLLRRAAATDFEEIGHDQLRLSALMLYAELACDLHDDAVAARLRSLLLPFADQIAFTGAAVYGPVRHALGLLARALGAPGDARRELEDAQRQMATLPAPLFTARSEAALAR